MNNAWTFIIKGFLILCLIMNLFSCRNSNQGTSAVPEIVKTDTADYAEGIVVNKDFCYFLFDSSFQQPLPLLVLFDPHANGSNAIKKYVSLAEDMNLILAASMVSKNGMAIHELKLHVKQVFEQIKKENLPVDFNRVIFAGFSGGGRVAIELAKEFNNSIGVISCGAADPVVKKPGFRNVIICGNEDFNYLECVYNAIDQAENSNFLFISFDGKHEWPSPGNFQKALKHCLAEKIYPQPLIITEEERIYLTSENTIRNELIESFTTRDFNWWINKIETFRNKAKSGQTLEKQLSNRILAYIGMLSYAYTKNSIETGNTQAARHCLQIYQYIEPENPDMLAFQSKLEVLLSEKK